MALEAEKFARFSNLEPTDANRELIRLARKGNTRLGEELRNFVEDDGVEEQYKVILSGLLSMGERLDPPKRKIDEDNAIEMSKRSEAIKKRKGKADSREQNDDCNAEEEEKNDPQYELFLKHLKQHDKSYVVECGKDCSPAVIAYEGGVGSDKKGDPEPEPRRELDRAYNVMNEETPRKHDGGIMTGILKLKSGPSMQMRGVENQSRHDPQSTFIRKAINTDKVEKVHGSPNDIMSDPRYLFRHQKVRVHGSPNDMRTDPRYLFRQQKVQLGGDHDMSIRKCQTVVNERINYQKREDARKLLRTMRPGSGFSYQMRGMENQWRTSVKETQTLTRGISRNETDKEENHLPRNDRREDDPYVRMHEGRTMVNGSTSGVNDLKEQSGRNLERNTKQKAWIEMPRSENQCKRGPQPAYAQKIKSSTLKKSRDDAQDVRIEKCSASEFMKVRAAKRLIAHENIVENTPARKGKGKIDSDVEILDEAAYVKRGILSPFVSSKKFARNMLEGGVQHVGGSSAFDEFREGVLNVLKKPYDRDEYTRHLEAVRDGRYLDYHPDLDGKLKKFRYNRRKRLAILRGFFFWLQNLTREGAFKPWKDRKCLAVEPPSP